MKVLPVWATLKLQIAHHLHWYCFLCLSHFMKLLSCNRTDWAVIIFQLLGDHKQAQSVHRRREKEIILTLSTWTKHTDFSNPQLQPVQTSQQISESSLNHLLEDLTLPLTLGENWGTFTVNHITCQTWLMWTPPRLLTQAASEKQDILLHYKWRALIKSSDNRLKQKTSQ